MKYVKLFEQFIKEDAMKPNPDSEVVADDITLENGKVISAAEIIGAIINSESEEDLENFFYDKYGQNAFKQGELGEIKKIWSEYQAETKEQEAEEEKDGGDGADGADGGVEDELADLESEA